jgi:transposase
MEQYSGIKETNDLTDAAWLAEQERLGIFPACYIYPKETRPVRDMLRRRQLLVRQRTQSLLCLQGLLERSGIPAPNAQTVKKWTCGEIEKTGLGVYVQHQLRALLGSLKANDREALRLEEIALGFAKPTQDFEQVQTVPGIAEVLGLLIMLESGEFSRFPSAGDYASYCRAVKSRRISNEKMLFG